MNDKVLFLGKSYATSPHDRCTAMRASLSPIDVYQRYDGDYAARTQGELYDLGAGGRGVTAQKAATALEKECISTFRKVGRALGYEVTG